MKAKRNRKMRLWWIPQVPMTRFFVEIPEAVAPASAGSKLAEQYMVETAKLLYRALGNYDKFQFENNIKPDYCNAGGLEVFEDGEWIEWCNEDGEDIAALDRA